MYLSIFLRTHDGKNFHGGNRFVDVDKKEIMIVSLKSLVSSINNFNKAEETLFTIIDDHSSEETLERMKKETAICKCDVNYIHLDNTGNGESLKKTYELAMANGANLIYFVEDDHLHKDTAVQFMVNAWEQFSPKLCENQVAIAPYDDPIDYHPDRITPTRIVASSDCHWRQNFHTTCTMMITKWILLHFWDKFMAVTNYGINGISEDNTINLMYDKEVVLFTPIPFQAVHLQTVPPVIGDWKSLYNINIPCNISQVGL